jgi:bla regulator protein BlaR1
VIGDLAQQLMVQNPTTGGSMIPKNNGRSRGTAFFLAIATILIAMPFFAQTPDGPRPAFEVASIKPYADPGIEPALLGFQNIPGSPRMDMKGVTFKELMMYAYAARAFQIIGGPDWITSDRYDIQAKAKDGSLPAPTRMRDLNVPDPMALRIQSLLDDRFQLKMHRETREVAVYELAVAKGGSKLRLSADQGPPEPPQPGAPPSPPSQTGGPPERGSLFIQRTPSGWTLQAASVPLSSLITALSQQTGRPIEDQSGLKAGLYDVKLQWAPDRPAGAAPAFGPVDPSGPSIFTAIQEQLGLRLVSSKGPVQVFVIDAVQKPSAN